MVMGEVGEAVWARLRAPTPTGGHRSCHALQPVIGGGEGGTQVHGRGEERTSGSALSKTTKQSGRNPEITKA